MTASLTGFVSPALARTCGSLTIEDGTVSPGTGTPSTTFTFAVTVSDTDGNAPTWVRLRVRGTWSDLAPTGSDWTGGVVFTGTRSLPVGSWGYTFRARTRRGQLRSHPGRSIARRRQRPATADSHADADSDAHTHPGPDTEADSQADREADSEADGRPDAATIHAQADRQAEQEAGCQADRQADGQTHSQAGQGDRDAARDGR